MLCQNLGVLPVTELAECSLPVAAAPWEIAVPDGAVPAIQLPDLVTHILLRLYMLKLQSWWMLVVGAAMSQQSVSSKFCPP
jgi:hypothetical protein